MQLAVNNKKRYQWFARCLLQGDIFDDLKCIKPYLQYRPHIITDDKYATVSNKAVIALISTLQQNDVDTKLKFELALARNSKFLLQELLMWVYKIKQYVLRKAWPPTK